MVIFEAGAALFLHQEVRMIDLIINMHATTGWGVFAAGHQCKT
jgi:hypothetical protein